MQTKINTMQEDKQNQKAIKNSIKNTLLYSPSPTRNIANKFDVPVPHVVPVHPVEHSHVFGETHDP